MANKKKSNKRGGAKRPQAQKASAATKKAAPATKAPAPATKKAAPAAKAPRASKPTQAERLEAARRARRRKRLQVRLAVGAFAALLLGLVVANAMGNRRETESFRDAVTAGTCEFDTRDDPTPKPPNNHVAPGGYEVNPPAGGAHAPGAAPAGSYEEGKAPSDAQVVHSLEHGYIAIWHRPGLEKKEMDDIRKVFNRYRRDILVLPRPSLPPEVKVAATAWGERLLCGKVEVRPLTDFVARYRNQGPEKVEHP